MTTSPFLVFSIGNERYCLGIDEVREIAAFESFQKVPCAPPCIKGISSLRGRIVTLIEPSEIFNIGCAPGLPFSAVILAPPHDNIGISVYSDIVMKEADEEAANKKEDRTAGPISENLPARTVRIDNRTHLLVHAGKVVSFCEERIHELFRAARPRAAQRG